MKLSLILLSLLLLSSCNSAENVSRGLVIDRYEYTDATCFKTTNGLSCIPKSPITK